VMASRGPINLQTMRDIELKVMPRIRDRHLEAFYPNLVRFFSKDPTATPQWARAIFDRLWSTDQIVPIPDVTPTSRDRVLVAQQLEKDMCSIVTRSLARKYIKAREIPPTPAHLVRSLGRIAGASIERDKKRNLDRICYDKGLLSTLYKWLRDVLDHR